MADKPMQYDSDELSDEDLANDNLHRLAQYTECNADQEQRIKFIRFAFSEMYKCIEYLCGDGREKSLSLTKLEEAQMWAIKGVTREENKDGKQES